MEAFDQAVNLGVVGGGGGVVCVPMVAQKEHQMAPQNCGPLSEVMAAGTPNRVAQAAMRAPAQSSAVIEASGTASIHLVVLSIIVKRYL